MDKVGGRGESKGREPEVSGGVDGSINVGIFLPTVSLEIFRGDNIRRFFLSTRTKPYIDAEFIKSSP